MPGIAQRQCRRPLPANSPSESACGRAKRQASWGSVRRHPCVSVVHAAQEPPGSPPLRTFDDKKATQSTQADGARNSPNSRFEVRSGAVAVRVRASRPDAGHRRH